MPTTHLGSGILIILVVLGGGGFASAQQQLVAFDEPYTATEKGNIPGESFHHRVDPRPTEPASWLTPVPYARGTAHVHLEVRTKPSKRKTILTICFDGEKAGYGCLDTDPYTDPGVYEMVRQMSEPDVWQYGKIAWGKPRGQYHLVVKDPGLGGTPGGTPATDFVPSDLRVVLTIVPPGGTYVPPGSSAAPADGGAPATADAGRDAAASPDAALPEDAAPAPAGNLDAAVSPPPTGGSGGSGSPAPGGSPAPSGSPTDTRPASPAGGCAVLPGAPLRRPLVSFVLVGLAAAALRRRRVRG